MFHTLIRFSNLSDIGTILINLYLIIDFYLFHDGASYHIEISSLIAYVNQWTSFYMIGTSVMKKFRSCMKKVLKILV